MSKFISLAWRNVWRNWRRSAIAMIAIVLGLIFLIFLDGLYDGVFEAIYGNFVRFYGGNVQVQAPGFRERARRLPLFPVADADAVVAAANTYEEVVAAAKRINTGGMVSSREGAYPVTITGIEPSVEAPVSLMAENIKGGRFLLDEDEDGIVIGAALAELLDVGVGDRVTLLGRRKDESMRQHSMTIVGLYSLGQDELEKGTVLINLPTAQTLYNLRGQETAVAITLEKVGQEAGLVPGLQNSLPGREVNSWESLWPELQQSRAFSTVFINFLSSVLLLIAGIGILNLMLMAVFERTREMGVLQALGMKGRQLMSLFLLEGMMIGAVGAVIGCLLGWLLVAWVGRVGLDVTAVYGNDLGDLGEIYGLMGNRLYPSIGLIDLLPYLIAVIVIAALASVIPARQAARSEPAEALHYV